MSVAAVAYIYGTDLQPIHVPDYLHGFVTLWGVSFARLPHLPGRGGARGHRRCWSRAGIHPLRRAGARRGRQPAHGARARHQCRRPFAYTFALGSGLAGLGGALAIEIVGLDQSFALVYLIYVLIIVSVGGLGSIGGSLLAAMLHRHQRHRRQILFPLSRRVSDLPGDDQRADVAAGRPVRETLSDGGGLPRGRRTTRTAILQRRIALAIQSRSCSGSRRCCRSYFTPAYLVLASQIAIAALFALSLDLILGYAGIVSLGHAAFFGMGAYTAGLISKWGWGEPHHRLLVAACAAGLLGYVDELHHRPLPAPGADHDHARPRPAAAEAANSASWLTGGADGLQGVNIWPIFGIFRFRPVGLHRLRLFADRAVRGVSGRRRLIHSPFGLSLRGIRENAVRMPAIGAASRSHIRKIYTISAVDRRHRRRA